MTVYVRTNKRKRFKRQVEIIDGVVGRASCFECAGTGRLLHPDGVRQCPVCNGTGKVYVSV